MTRVRSRTSRGPNLNPILLRLPKSRSQPRLRPNSEGHSDQSLRLGLKTQKFISGLLDKINMVNAIKGIFISCDVPMAQFIVNLNNAMPANEKFIVHMLDSTHMFVQPHVAEMIRSRIAEFRDQNSYDKPQ
ncbi:General transcription factor IIH subunit 5 [Rhynchospora pubera]|uniref:General transcription and DNA repair factor IIH subunit TFB5 n=1 Tax=Rhynchospora pubera TaxID=906938 RepID=A0AAV8CNF8_9POAL|nr:General transcription factor IIH subunit 5 [Rhynchospora pubera]